jgi:hypothetical protein
MRRGLAALLVLPLMSARAAAADLPLGGIVIGSSVNAVARTLGPPAAVTSLDSGNGFAFADGATAYADDDGVVLAVDLRSGRPRVDVDGTARAFPIGEYSTARADAELANVAEFATSTLRSYRLGPRRDLVLAFAPASNRLERLAYGEPGQLARLGLLPGDAAAKAVVYHAPRRRGTSAASASAGTRTAVYRVTVDRAGAVQRVDVIIPSSDPAADAEAARMLAADRYAPATLDGRPIAGAVFVELHP